MSSPINSGPLTSLLTYTIEGYHIHKLNVSSHALNFFLAGTFVSKFAIALANANMVIVLY